MKPCSDMKIETEQLCGCVMSQYLACFKVMGIPTESKTGYIFTKANTCDLQFDVML